MELNGLSVDRLARSIRNKEVSCQEVISFSLNQIKRIESGENKLNAFLNVNEAGALAEAREIDDRIARGDPVPSLAGIPIAVKDNICVRDMQTTCGSRILYNYVSPYDATAVAKLKQQGMIIIGKTNLDEFAMGSSTENSCFSPTRNPFDVERTPGGSSGGSAVAVATGCCPVALGSDTGGSVRQPASFCGVVGVKPTYGRVSRYGLVAFASSFDQIGVLANNVRDAALLIGTIAGRDAKDSTSVDEPVNDYVAELDRDISGVRIGIPLEFFTDDLDPRIEALAKQAAGRLQELGAEVVDIELPHTKYAVATYYIITPAEASANLARYDGVRYGLRNPDATSFKQMYSQTRSAGFGSEVQRRILIGTYVLSAGYYDAYYLKAQKVRKLFRQDFRNAFQKVDAILTPTTPTTAFRLGEKTDDPISMYLSDVFTCSANLAGIPAISIPAGKIDSLPSGIQILTNDFEEALMFRVANALETSYLKPSAAS